MVVYTAFGGGGLGEVGGIQSTAVCTLLLSVES